MSLSLLLEQILNGIILGSMYALMGGGLALIYGTLRILNFAHGEFFMLGGFGIFFLYAQLGMSPFLAIPLAVLMVAFVGMLFQRLTVHYLVKKDGWAFSTIAATLGFSIMLQNLALILWGERFQPVPYYIEGTLSVGDLRMAYQRLLVLAVASVALMAMAFMLRYTRLGQAIRATAQDSEAASVVGVPTAHIRAITFGLGAGLAALAATMLSPLYAVSPWMGIPLMLKAFAVVILGGLGSFTGAIIAGFALGIVEAIGVTLTAAEWRDVISFTFLIIFIWIRPWGLFGTAEQ
jgi:branched-chain amino acid transport system permease protein